MPMLLVIQPKVCELLLTSRDVNRLQEQTRKGNYACDPARRQ